MYIKFINPILFKSKNIYRYSKYYKAHFTRKCLAQPKHLIKFVYVCVCLFFEKKNKRKKNMNDHTKHKNNDRKKIKKK